MIMMMVSGMSIYKKRKKVLVPGMSFTIGLISNIDTIFILCFIHYNSYKHILMGKFTKDNRDIYYRKAKEEGFRARSAYKLI
jgi:hypothetical protein